MPCWQSGDLNANGIRLHYTRTGGAKPPLVLAHGFSDDGLCWTPVAEALSADHDVVMVDARCHGRSEAPDQTFGPADQAEDLAGAIAALGLRRPLVLGHSMGAITMLLLAGTHPDVPRAVLLEDPPAWWMPDADHSPANEERRARMRTWLTGLQGKTREELMAQQRAATPHWSEDEIGPWADAKLRLHPHVFNRGTMTGIDWPAVVRRVTCPALLLTGDPDRGAIVTEEQAAGLRALVPHLRVAHIPEAGHSIRRDQRARYLDAVRAFLAELPDD